MELDSNQKRQPKDAGKPGLAARLVATRLLTRVVDDGRNLDALCDASHGMREFLVLEARDRSLARAIAVTALRYRRPIDQVISWAADRKPPRKARFLIHSLHVAMAQVLFMDIEDRAAIDLAVSAIGNDDRTRRFKSFANAILRRVSREKQDLLAKTVATTPLLPQWMEKMLRSDHGKEKLARISAMVAHEPFVDISVKSDPKHWAEKLGGFVLPTGSVRLMNRDAIHQLAGYEEGEWWVQDAAASVPARLIESGRPLTVLDLCAAPGGKTAQLVQAGHEVTAVEISKPRIVRLEQNLARLGFSARIVEADILEWEGEETFDAVLLDAPCSSTGTIRRHPDVMWAKNAEDIEALANLQLRLIQRASRWVKENGQLIFANCSMLKQEGEALLTKILKENDELKLDPIQPEELPGMEELINGQGAVRTLPYHFAADPSPHGGADGFFACRFVRS